MHKSKMALRLPLRSLLRDMIIMCCGSILGLLLARVFVGDVPGDMCAPIHIVKRMMDDSRQAGSRRPETSDAQNYSIDEGQDWLVNDLGLYDSKNEVLEEEVMEDVSDIGGETEDSCELISR